MAHSPSRRSACEAVRSLPGQADLAEAGQAGPHGDVPGSGRDRQGDAEIRARLVDTHAARDVDEDVSLAEGDPGVPAEHGDDHREALRVDARPNPPRHREVSRSNERLDLEQQRPRPLERTGDHGSSLVGFAVSEDLGRIGDPDEPVRGHLEDAELVRRAEPVLGCPQDAMLAIAVALELEDAVDQVLEDARPGDGAVLRDVTDEEDGHSLLLGDPQEAAGRFANLRHGAGSRADVRRVERLDRVDHADVRPLALDGRADEVEIRLGQDLDPAGAAEPVGAELHLGRRLLACDERDLPRAAHRAQGHEQQRRLPDPRVAADEDERGRDESASQHPIELGNAGRKPVGLGRLDLVESNEGLRDGGRGRAAPLLGALLEKRSPRAAAGATPEPLPGRVAALGAHVLDDRLRHVASLWSGPDGPAAGV